MSLSVPASHGLVPRVGCLGDERVIAVVGDDGTTLIKKCLDVKISVHTTHVSAVFVYSKKWSLYTTQVASPDSSIA